MIYVKPGEDFEATIAGAPTGLAGTIGVRILDNEGATTVARSTAGIIEYPAGSGLYAVTLTAPEVDGQYTVMWDTGSVAPSTIAAEDLVITGTLPGVPSSPPEGDLTTVEAVREFLQKGVNDTKQDDVIKALITSASALISRHTQRQFVEEKGAAKTFEWEYQAQPQFLSLAPFELQSVTSVRLDTDTESPTTLDAAQYRLWPRHAPDGTFPAIRLNPYNVGAPAVHWGPRREVEITGTWGLKAIPSDVAHWCVVTVSIWLKRDVAAFASGMKIDEGYVERPRALPSAVVGGLDLWRRFS